MFAFSRTVTLGFGSVVVLSSATATSSLGSRGTRSSTKLRKKIVNLAHMSIMKVLFKMCARTGRECSDPRKLVRAPCVLREEDYVPKSNSLSG